jgi:outer membrane receptor protein involved in Fe transport
MKHTKARILLASASLLVLAGHAWAQTAPASAPEPSSSTVDEIVVTAQKKSESLQVVPIAVSAFSEQALKAQRIDSAGNLALSVPNLNFSQQLYGTSNFQIRGIGYQLVTTAGDQGVGVAENYAPLDRSRVADSEFYDVERVEVLRGPQGTLYGRNATGGIINIITNKPRYGDNSGSGTVEVGNYNSLRVKGYANVSPADNFAIRIAGFAFGREGTRYNEYTDNDIDGRRIFSVRTTLAYEPFDNFRAYAMWEHFDENDSRTGGSRTVCAADPGPTSVGGVPVNNVNAQAYLSQGCKLVSIYDRDVLTGVSNSASSLSGQLTNLLGYTTGNVNAGTVLPNDPYRTSLIRDPRTRTTNDNYQLNLEWDLTPSLKLTSLTNKNTDDVLQTSAQAPSSTPFNVRPLTPGGMFTDPQIGTSAYLSVLSYNKLFSEQVSEELRLQSSFNGPLNFNLGAIYINIKRRNDVYFFANGQTIYVQTAIPSAHVDPNRTPDGSGHNYYFSSNTYELDSLAGFGEVYYKPVDSLKITIGLRYTDDEKTAPYQPLPLFSPGSGLTTLFIQKAEFKEVTGRASVDWQATPDNLLYASYSRGYKGGGFNPPDLATQTANAYSPEYVDAFEIGAKNRFLDRTLTLNLTGFYYKYNDFQYTVSTGLSTATRNINTTLYGLELESVWKPIPPLTINANIGYLHTEIEKGPNNLAIDPFNITGGDPNLVALKNTSIACVGTVAGVAGIVGLINAGILPSSALLGACPTAAAPNGPLAALGLTTTFGVPTDITGNRLPTSPEFSVSLGGQYEFELPSGWTLTPRADFHYQSSVEGDVYNNPNNHAKSWTNVNATVTLANPNGWEVQAFARNLFDSDAITAVGVNGASLGLTRQVYYLDPRTFGLSLTKSF